MKRTKKEIVYVDEPMGRRTRRLIFRWIRRGLLLLIAAAAVYGFYAYRYVETVLTGPSTAARDRMALFLFEDENTSWLPGKFMSEKEIAALGSVTGKPEDHTEPAEEKDLPVNMDLPLSEASSEWDAFPDGIQIRKIPGETYHAYAMLIRDPSRVYLGLSNQKLSSGTPGKRITEAMESQKAVAAINSGAFFDDGTSDLKVGATPEGLVISEGSCAWQWGTPPSKGFVGFDKDNKLIVNTRNLSKEEAEQLNIRDGCCFGPVLVMDGKPNEAAYDMLPGRQPRTAIGQRADGTVIFLCVDGRQASSVGGTIHDVVDLMLELGAENACNMDGGSSTVMMYRDSQGQYGEADKTYMVNSYSQLQPAPRRMPDYWMVRPEKEG